MKPLYLKRKHQFHTNSQSWKQVMDFSSQDRISVGYIIPVGIWNCYNVSHMVVFPMFANFIALIYLECYVWVVTVASGTCTQWRIQDFLLGGSWAIGGGTDLWRGCFLAKTCKNERIGSRWGGGGAAGAPWICQRLLLAILQSCM